MKEVQDCFKLPTEGKLKINNTSGHNRYLTYIY